MINKLLLVFLCVFTMVSCKSKKEENLSRVDALPYFEEASFTPKWISPNSNQLNNFHKIPDFNLVNQHGTTINAKTFENKIYVADFFFTTCPGICPAMTKNMDVLQKEFLEDDEILLLSHSVTPTIDSVPQLKKYALEHGIQKNWHLVTGDKQQIYDLGRKFYFVEENLGAPKSVDDFLHTENFVLIDKRKHIRGIYNGLNRSAVRQLIADIKTLKKEN